MRAPKITTVSWSPTSQSGIVTKFLKRPAAPLAAEETARKVLVDIKKRGDAAVLEYAAKFDGTKLKVADLRIREEEIVAAGNVIDSAFKKAAKETLKRVVAFSKKGLSKNWEMPTGHGGTIGEKFTPLQRVGAYIPGGTAPLVSTALMTVPIAKTAGVPEIVACTPADADGRVNPYILYALKISGVTEIYRIGGIQAIGAMAYGTRAIRKVQKIVGPGGPYVTAAKRQVYGDVGLDMVAGPSEIAILADTSANPAHVAADLLSQAEHGSAHEKTLLVSTSVKLAENVKAELIKQTKSLSRQETILKVLNSGTLLVVVKNIDNGIKLCNLFAPEHMELIVRNPQKLIAKIKTAGALFIGPWTPESAGDFVAGPSHVLPTGGTAAIFSGLTVNDFQRRTSIIEFTRKDLEQTRETIEVFGRVETLDAHAHSASIRFKKD